jgi:hypothetical protein
VKIGDEVLQSKDKVSTQAVTSDKREAQSNVAALFIVKPNGKKRKAA